MRSWARRTISPATHWLAAVLGRSPSCNQVRTHLALARMRPWVGRSSGPVCVAIPILSGLHQTFMSASAYLSNTHRHARSATLPRSTARVALATRTSPPPQGRGVALDQFAEAVKHRFERAVPGRESIGVGLEISGPEWKGQRVIRSDQFVGHPDRLARTPILAAEYHGIGWSCGNSPLEVRGSRPTSTTA